MSKKNILLISVAILLFSISACYSEWNYLSLNIRERARFNKLYKQLGEETSYEKRFIIVRQILEFLTEKVTNGEINLFLTTYVEKNPDDPFNAYYLMVIARKFREDLAFPFAVDYYERILGNYHDLMYRGNSIHFLALRDLMDIVDDDEARILYYKDIITRFSSHINVSEIYYRLGNTYARIGEWDEAIQAYSNFLNSYDGSISADSYAREGIVEFLAYYNTNVNWTFESLDELVDRVIADINSAKANGSGRLLRPNMSRVNFFTVSWEDRERTVDPEFIANLGVFLSPRISISRTLDSASNQHEAYLRTTGWSYRIPTWYLYFRRVNFPADSEIHRNWEWAGIYLGEKPFAVSEER